MRPQFFETNHGELISLEKQYWSALQRGDLPAVLELTLFPCVVAGADGIRVIDQPSFEASFREMAYVIDHFELSEVDVQFPAKDVAIVSYLLEQELTADGDHQQQRCANTSTWVRAGDRWKCAQHSEAPLRETLH